MRPKYVATYEFRINISILNELKQSAPPPSPPSPTSPQPPMQCFFRFVQAISVRSSFHLLILKVSPGVPLPSDTKYTYNMRNDANTH